MQFHLIKTRCSLDLSIHVLEAMQGVIISAETKKEFNLTTKPNQPKILEDSYIKKLKN